MAPREKHSGNDANNGAGDYLRLASEECKNDSIYRLVERSSKVAFYEQWMTNWKGELFLAANEVFKIKMQRERTFNGRYFPRKEKYPANEDFGKTAFTFPNLDTAYLRYLELINKYESDYDPVVKQSIF